ncbi:hypothetical protein GZL_01543 [Streptomyces sp. 769]|nr:hypothetical protein GZL_01543 [Streptomyces sp. 769]
MDGTAPTGAGPRTASAVVSEPDGTVAGLPAGRPVVS